MSDLKGSWYQLLENSIIQVNQNVNTMLLQHAFRTSIPKVKEFPWFYLEHFAHLENQVKGNAYISQFNGADVAPLDIQQFSQLELRDPHHFAVINNIQAKLSVLIPVFFFHARHLYY